LEIKPDRFELIKEDKTRDYANYRLDPPYYRSSYNVSLLIENQKWSNEQYLKAIKTVTLSDIESFYHRLISQLYIESIYMGNLTLSEARNSKNKVIEILNSSCLSSGQFPERRTVRLRKDRKYIFRMNGLNPDEPNSSINNYYQLENENLSTNNMVEFFSTMVSNECFNTLRTKEQLGYITYCNNRSDMGMKAFSVTIQSDVKDPVYLDTRIENWIATLEKFITDLSESEYDNHLKGFINTKLEKDKSLNKEFGRFKREITGTKCYIFDRMYKDVEISSKFTKKDVLDFYNNFIKSGAPKRRKLSVQVYGKDCKMEPIDTKEDPSLFIISEDMKVFKREHKLCSLVYDRNDFVKDE
jgi:insulysin